MTSPSALLERYKLQTFDLKPDKYVHVLSAEQAGGVPVQILYKKRGGSAGQLGGGSFGAVHLQDADSEVGLLPRIRAVKSISKDVARANKIHWEQEVENLIALSKVRYTIMILCFVPASVPRLKYNPVSGLVRHHLWVVGRRQIYLSSNGVFRCW